MLDTIRDPAGPGSIGDSRLETDNGFVLPAFKLGLSDNSCDGRSSVSLSIVRLAIYSGQACPLGRDENRSLERLAGLKSGSDGSSEHPVASY